MSAAIGGMVVTPPASADDVGCRACYGVVVACLSLLLFCVLAGTVGVVKACAATGLALALFGFVGWVAAARRPDGGGSEPAAAMLRARQAWGLAAAAAEAVVRAPPPAFAYDDCDKPGGGCAALCAVCLEDVQRGDPVRRLPACGHLFHRDCVDMWLHSHATCPLCRSDLLAPPSRAAKSVAVAPPV